MLELDYPIPEKNWLSGIERNGVLPKSASDLAVKTNNNVGAWEPTIQKIVSFRDLVDDWDGFGATAPSRELLESAIGLGYVLSEKGVLPPHCVVAGVAGSVTLEWHDPDGSYAEVEIVRPLYAEVMVIEPGQPAKHWTLPTD